MELMKSSSNIIKTERKPYMKPHVETVSMRPKETVLGVCKSASFNNNVNLGGVCNIATSCLIDSF